MVDLLAFAVIAISVSLATSLFCAKRFGLSAMTSNVTIGLGVWHAAFLYAFLVFSQDQVSDSANYFAWSDDVDESTGWTGTGFIVRLVELIRFVGIDDYWFACGVFSFMSYVGMVFVLLTLDELSYFSNGKRLPLGLVALLFIPGLHFWSVAVGKDAICVLALGVGVSSLSPFARYKFLRLASSCVLLFLARPHLAIPCFFVFFAFWYFGVVKRFDRLLRLVSTTGFALVFGLVLVAAYWFLLDVVQKYSVAGFDGVGEFLDSRGDIYAATGSGVSLNEVPLVVRPLYFLISVLPWQIASVAQLVSMIEGLVFLFLLFSSARNLWSKTWDDGAREARRVAFWVFCLALLVVVELSLISGNAGLAVRLRIFPGLLLVVCVSLIRLRLSARS